MKHLFYLAINRVKKGNFLLFPFFLISVIFVILPIGIIGYYALFLSSSSAESMQLISKSVIKTIFRSTYIATVVLICSLCLAYPTSYFILNYKSIYIKSFLILLLSMPIWSNYFIKLIGLKSVLDYIHGYENSTYGIAYSIFGLTYIFTPIAVLTIYNTLKNMPKNLIFSSQDLGLNKFETFCSTIVPYTKVSLLAVVSLIFLPSFFSVAPSAFLNNENGSKMIGELITELASSDFENNHTKAKVSFLVLVIIVAAIFIYLLCKWIPKIYTLLRINFKKTYKHAV